MKSKFQEWLARERNRGRGWDKIVHRMLPENAGSAGYVVWVNYREPGELARTPAHFFSTV